MSGESGINVGLREKKALVAGAYGGMGAAVALALAREGTCCALLGKRTEKLLETARRCEEAGTWATTVTCDLAEPGQTGSAVSQALSELGGLHFLINCAGVYANTPADVGDLTAWDKIVDVNLRSTYHLTRHALPEINKTPGGAVVKIGSIESSYAGGGAFVATTRALDGYADAMFEDVREYGTKVCTIRPGFVNTTIGLQAIGASTDSFDTGRMIQPEDIALTILFVLTMPSTACPTEITLRPQRSPYR